MVDTSYSLADMGVLEFKVQGTAVNPHSYLRTTMAELGGVSTGGR